VKCKSNDGAYSSWHWDVYDEVLISHHATGGNFVSVHYTLEDAKAFHYNLGLMLEAVS